MIKTFNSLLATMFGLGKIKIIPGTFGSLATIIFNLQNYFKKKTNVTDIVIKFKMKNPKKKYHIPVIIAPNGYSVWWSK